MQVRGRKDPGLESHDHVACRCDSYIVVTGLFIDKVPIEEDAAGAEQWRRQEDQEHNDRERVDDCNSPPALAAAL